MATGAALSTLPRPLKGSQSTARRRGERPTRVRLSSRSHSSRDMAFPVVRGHTGTRDDGLGRTRAQDGATCHRGGPWGREQEKLTARHVCKGSATGNQRSTH